MPEDLADRQVVKQPHGEYDPQDDIMSQGTLTAIDPSGDRECLLDLQVVDNLFKSRHRIQNPARFIDR